MICDFLSHSNHEAVKFKTSADKRKSGSSSGYEVSQIQAALGTNS